jgi:hypothetical protein
MDRSFIEGRNYEILINRVLKGSNERYAQLANLINSEGGMSFSGFGTTKQHLENTKKILIKALKKMAGKLIIPKDVREELERLAFMTDRATASSPICDIVDQAMELTNNYKEVL